MTFNTVPHSLNSEYFYISGINSMENKFSSATLYYINRDIQKERWMRELHYWNNNDYSLIDAESMEEDYINGISSFKQNI